MHGVH